MENTALHLLEYNNFRCYHDCIQ